MLQHMTKSDPMMLAGVVLLLGLFISLMMRESVVYAPHSSKKLTENIFATEVIARSALPYTPSQNAANNALQLNAGDVSDL